MALTTLSSVAYSASPGSDPYAGDYNRSVSSAYRLERTRFLSVVHMMYFAVGCKVISEVAAMPVINGAATVADAQAVRSGIIDRDGESMMRSAAAAGLHQASQPGACAYWHEHPEAVYAIRQQAIAAASGAF